MPRQSAHDTIPPRPVGDDEAAHWFQWVHDFLTLRGNFIDTPQIRFEKTTKGIRPILAQQPGGTNFSLSLYRLKSVEDNYLVGRAWDGTTEGDTDVYIAKRPETREVPSAILYGVTYNYTYLAGPDALNYSRVSDNGATTEAQLVTPPWELDGLIFASPVPFSGVLAHAIPTDSQSPLVDLKLMDTSPRCWAKPEA
jgi:hypothetical protein